MRKKIPRAKTRKNGPRFEAGTASIAPTFTALALLAAGCAVSVSRPVSDGTPLAALGWLAGEWVAETERSRVRETWQKVSGATLEGFAVVTRGETGEVHSSETLRIVAMSGEIFYIAKVTENPLPVPFRLTAQAENRFQFENPDHDFPTKIVYERHGENQMRAIVSGPGGGFTLQFRRAN